MVTGLYAGLCGILLVVLYVRVSQRRLAIGIGLGAGGDTVLEQRIRAHGNFIETVPLALILLYLFERSAADPMHVHVLGALLVVARLGHAQGLSSTAGRSVGRLYGSVATVGIIAVLSLALLAQAIRA
ncbi:MAG: MAPEG family protein [Gammaproteobacteria bacterium]